MQYLYIYEDGAMEQTDNKPSAEDLLQVDNGILTILTFDYGKYWDMDGCGDTLEIPIRVKASDSI